MTDLTPTVAVTRNGRGDLWKFGSANEAMRHPLYQYGDALLCGPDDLRRQFNRLMINELLRKLGDEQLRIDFMSSVSTAKNHREVNEVYDRLSPSVWLRMQIVSREVPDDVGEVFKQILYDRDHYNDGLPKDRTMTDKTQTTEEKAPKAPKAPKYPLDAKIVMLADQEGNAYSPENNPKRAGSKSADRFAFYGNGVTVTEFLAAGGSTADIDNDIKKEFIKVEAAS